MIRLWTTGIWCSSFSSAPLYCLPCWSPIATLPSMPIFGMRSDRSSVYSGSSINSYCRDTKMYRDLFVLDKYEYLDEYHRYGIREYFVCIGFKKPIIFHIHKITITHIFRHFRANIKITFWIWFSFIVTIPMWRNDIMVNPNLLSIYPPFYYVSGTVFTATNMPYFL